ncbi:hypothetical protein BJY00DRAFT_319627 [Aspergillus carlsbadensis]|nr:hypothetical protein BJY00DRAFT_319627 [Aspergillus carlsbadensis]
MAGPHKAIRLADTLTCILLHVENRTLLRAQRVCRWWRDLIQGSPDLQVKLFFKPAIACPYANKAPSLNPIFTSHLKLATRPPVKWIKPREDLSWKEMLVFQPYLRTMLVLEALPSHSLTPPIQATKLHFDPDIIKRVDQLRVPQICCPGSWYAVLSLPIITRAKDRGDGKEVTRFSWKDTLAVSDDGLRFRFLRRLFYDRPNRPSGDFYDLVFIRSSRYNLFGDNTVPRREEQWTGMFPSPLDDWLRSVKPWARVDQQWSLSSSDYKELAELYTNTCGVIWADVPRI